MEQDPPRRVVIDGQVAIELKRRPRLPPNLAGLLRHLRVYPVRITGWRSDCGEQSHRLTLLADGPYRGSDGVVRDLRVEVCADCEAVCVRDVSYDTLGAYGIITRTPARLMPRRRNAVLGWYTGARRNQREYHRL